MKLCSPVVMQDHIRHPSGKFKTVCVTACLTAIGVPFSGFNVTGTLRKPNYLGILNRFGFTARSRKSKMPKNPTVGSCRKAIKKLDESGTVYFVVLAGASYCHAMLMDKNGETTVDTDPRKRDQRKVHSVHAVRFGGSE